MGFYAGFLSGKYPGETNVEKERCQMEDIARWVRRVIMMVRNYNAKKKAQAGGVRAR